MLLSPLPGFCSPRYDVVLDNVGGVDTERWALGLLRPWSGAKYVTLVSPLLHSTDAVGLVEGMARSGCSLHSKALQVKGHLSTEPWENDPRRHVLCDALVQRQCGNIFAGWQRICVLSDVGFMLIQNVPHTIARLS